jgi:hypothetical protein
MPEEITQTLSLRLKHDNLIRNYDLPTEKIDQAVQAISDTTQVIPTSWTQIVIAADDVTLGKALFRNLDVDNYLQLGIIGSTGPTIKPFGRLKPGESNPFRLEPGISYWAKANTASCRLQTVVMND